MLNIFLIALSKLTQCKSCGTGFFAALRDRRDSASTANRICEKRTQTVSARSCATGLNTSDASTPSCAAPFRRNDAQSILPRHASEACPPRFGERQPFDVRRLTPPITHHRLLRYAGHLIVRYHGHVAHERHPALSAAYRRFPHAHQDTRRTARHRRPRR